MSDVRRKSIVNAISSSLLYRASGYVVQILAIPIGIRALGVEGYALYAVSYASVAWILIGSGGIAPLVTTRLAKSLADENLTEARILVSTAFMPAILFAVLLGVLSQTVPENAILRFFQHKEIHTEVVSLWRFLLLAMAISIPLSIVEAVNSGRQKMHRNNVALLFGNLATVPLIAIWVPTSPSITNFALAILGPQLIFRSLNGLALWVTARSLRPSFSAFSITKFRAIISSCAAFVLIQAGGYLYYQAPLLALAATSTSADVVAFSVCIQLVFFSGSIVQTICQPLVAPFADASHRNDRTWLDASLQKLLVGGMTYALTAGLALAIAGPAFVEFWLGRDIGIPVGAFILTACFSILNVWSYMHYTFFVSQDMYWTPGFLLFAEGVISIALAVYLIDYFGIIGVAASMVIASTAITFHLFPYLRRRLSNTIPIG